MGKNDPFLNLKFERIVNKKNPYLNSCVCFLVFNTVSGAINSDPVEF